MEIVIKTFDALRRSFAMMALAKLSNRPREELFKQELSKVSVNGVMKDVFEEVPKLINLPDEFRATRLPNDVADKLRERVARGDVTTIVAKPEPFTWIILKSGHEEFRTIYGLWVGRPASWRGKINPDALPRLGLTGEEAAAKGIPIPSFAKD